MQPDRDDFESLLESVADGTAIDWAALDRSAVTSADRARYRNLRLVARVAELHRTLVLDEEEAPSTFIEQATTEDPATWGHLAITSRVASGAFGRIYRAHDPQLNRDVALKLLRGDIALFRPVERLLGEARTLAQVRHPNVVSVYGADVRDGRAGLWMELVEGQTLEVWLGAHGPMGAGEATTIGIDLCRALAAVHAAGLVHGDVKAQNVMREKGGRIVLMDFGAGRTQGADAVGVAGTPMYLAPEVLAGEPPTPESDLYSLGVLLFHLLTSSFPSVGVDLESLRAAHADGERRWLRDLRPDLPRELVQTIERAIDPDPARRFATAGEMEQALASTLQLVPAAPARTTVRRFSPMLGFGLGALALLSLVVGLIVWSGRAVNPVGAPAVRSIAVLPITDLSGSLDRQGLADGLHAQLITTLGEIQAMRVVSRTSVMQFKGSQSPSGRIARTLGVDAALESTVSYVESGLGNTPRVRVNSSLIMAGEDLPLWSRTFERPLGDLLALEADIARAITASVHAPLTATESLRLTHPQHTTPAAEDAYFHGREQVEQYGSDRARRALEAFNRAIALDPQYALAHVGAAHAYISLGFNGDISHPEARASAFPEIQRALAIDENLPDARAALGDVKFYYDWDWSGAEAEYKRALDANPSFTYARKRYAGLLAAARRLDQAVEESGKAVALDPLSIDAAVEHGMVLYYRRDYGPARDVLSHALEREPGWGAAWALIARIDEAERRFDEALDATTKVQQSAGGANIGLRVQIIRLEALTGRREEARRHLDDLQQSVAASRQRMPAQQLAYAELSLGNRDRALDLLEEAVNQREPGLLWLAVDPRVDPLRPIPRFNALLARLGVPDVPVKRTGLP